MYILLELFYKVSGSHFQTISFFTQTYISSTAYHCIWSWPIFRIIIFCLLMLPMKFKIRVPFTVKIVTLFLVGRPRDHYRGYIRSSFCFEKSTYPPGNVTYPLNPRCFWVDEFPFPKVGSSFPMNDWIGKLKVHGLKKSQENSDPSHQKWRIPQKNSARKHQQAKVDQLLAPI